MSIVDLRAWMADHVFVTIGIVVVLTALLLYLGMQALRELDLRLLQFATGLQMVLGVAGLVVGVRNGDLTVVALGLGGAVAGALALYAGRRLHAAISRRTADIKIRDDQIRQLQTNSGLRLVVEQSGKPGEKTA